MVSAGFRMSSTPWSGWASRISTPSRQPCAQHGIDCNFERTGMVDVATEPWQYKELVEVADTMRAHGYRVDTLDADAMRSQVASPSYHGGLWIHDRTAIVNPAKLAWGLRRACIDAGVRIHDNSAVTRLVAEHRADPAHHRARRVSARRVALATNADRPLLRTAEAVHPSRVRLRARHRTAQRRNK